MQKQMSGPQIMVCGALLPRSGDRVAPKGRREEQASETGFNGQLQFPFHIRPTPNGAHIARSYVGYPLW